MDQRSNRLMAAESLLLRSDENSNGICFVMNYVTHVTQNQKTIATKARRHKETNRCLAKTLHIALFKKELRALVSSWQSFFCGLRNVSYVRCD